MRDERTPKDVCGEATSNSLGDQQEWCIFWRSSVLIPFREGLSEEKSRYPKHGRRFNVIPLLKKLEASNQIIDVTAERFKRWVRLLHLQTRDFAFKDAARHLL